MWGWLQIGLVFGVCISSALTRVRNRFLGLRVVIKTEINYSLNVFYCITKRYERRKYKMTILCTEVIPMSTACIDEIKKKENVASYMPNSL